MTSVLEMKTSPLRCQPVSFDSGDRSLKKKTRLRRSAFVMRDESIRADLVRTDLSSQLRVFVPFF